MEDGYLQVSVYSEDGERSQTLEQELDVSLSQVLNSNQYSCSCSSKENHESASQHHISFGKYQVIEDIVKLNSSYKIEDLQDESMQELRQLYSDLSGNCTYFNHYGNGNHRGKGNQQGTHHNK